MDVIRYLLKRNEEIALGFQRIEERFARAPDIVRLFSSWISGMMEVFAIPFVWVSILNEDRTFSIFNTLEQSPFLRERLNRVDADYFLELLGGDVKPVLANGNLKSFYRLLPPRNKYFIRSIAVVPIESSGSVVGSINHGDFLPDRYDPAMDVSLLQNLAYRFSMRLTDLCRGIS
ncbi:MAG: GAF domain-containing protein [Syntrophales bacterium]|nr:GAF domain-containing protein [Syntrophales bacterium]